MNQQLIEYKIGKHGDQQVKQRRQNQAVASARVPEAGETVGKEISHIKVFTYLLVFLYLPIFELFAQPSWTKTNEISFGSAIAGFSVGNKGYIITLGKELWEYDPTVDGWQKKANYPGQADDGLTAFSIGTKGYAGLGRTYSVHHKDFWEYNPVTNVWTQLPDFVGVARKNAVGFSIGTKGYVGMGVNYPTYFIGFKDLWEFDPLSGTWTQKTGFPHNVGADWRGGFSINSNGYLGYYNEFWEYNPSTNTWVRKADYPGDYSMFGGYYSQGFSIGGKGYMGLGNADTNFFEYTQSSNTWTRVDNFPGIGSITNTNPHDLQGRFGNIGFSIGSKGFIGFGSGIGAGGSAVDLWQLNPAQSSTSCVSKGDVENLARLYSYTDGTNWVNKWTGTDESAWYGVTINSCQVSDLDLHNNNLTGIIPGLLTFPVLEMLNLSHNQLTGSIPNRYSLMPLLAEYNLSHNQLTGTLPSDFLMYGRGTLNFSNNNITGSIPDVSPFLYRLKLSNNQLSGTIPSTIGNANSIQVLKLSHNNLSGNIPIEIGDMGGFLGMGVDSIDLSYNQLTGNIPIEVWNTYAPNINLSNNQLSGTVPNPPNSYFRSINLSNNQFSGALPAGFGSMVVETLDIRNNLFTSVPTFDLQQSANNFSRAIVKTEYNRLDFNSIEPNYLRDQAIFLSDVEFSYNPQLDRLRSILQESPGNSITLNPAMDSTATTSFQWYKNGVAIPGATYVKIKFNNLQLSDEGVYTLKQTSSIVTDFAIQAEYLLLLTPPVAGVIPQQEREALTWFYYSTGGPSWANNNNWLNNDERTWYGITVDNFTQHVTNIYLPNNNLKGRLPQEITNLSQLQQINLSTAYYFSNRNFVEGIIPASIGQLSQLYEINLDGNKISGSIPPQLGQLQNLTTLRIGYNDFFEQGDLSGSIPPELGLLTNLQSLNLEGNQLNGTIPSELGNLSQLNYLSLGRNGLSGSIPPSLGNLSSLQFLSLYWNHLDGSIPAALGNLSNLTYLDLQINQLSGSIPLALTTLPQLQGLVLRSNQLTGSIPVEIANLSNLNLLWLDYNQLTGTIPKELANVPLGYLWLNNNQLTGPIPPELGGSSTLTYLQLQSNLLTGGIPKELGNATTLKHLFLGQNPLGGTIPVELSNLTNLQILSIGEDQLTGTIPSAFGNLTQLQELTANNNQLTGTLPTELGNLNLLTKLQLSSNQFSGNVPTEFGNLIQLRELYLSSNQFLSAFPTSIGALANLRFVHLQGNQFTDIPLFSSPKNQLKVENNLLDFGDLEPNAGKGGFTYSPQGTVLSGGVVNSTIGCPFTIPFTTLGASNRYQWYKDGTLIPGATSMALTLPNGYATDNGNYTVAVTNTLITGLTLTSAPWQVTIGGTPITPPSAPNGAGCVNTQVTLTATGATGTQQYRWYNVISGGTSLSSLSSYTTPMLTSTTDYYVSIFDPSGSCESSRTTVSAVINGNSPTPTNGSGCGPTSSITISASGGTNGQYRWYTVPSGGSPIPGEVNSSYVTPMLSNSTTYYVSIDNGLCESPRASVQAQIASINAPTTTSASACTSAASLTLSATGASGTQEYRWYNVTVGGTSLSSSAAFDTPVLSTTTSYYVAVNNGSCESARTAVVATINPVPSAPTVPAVSICGSGVATIAASGGSAGQYRWYSVASGGTAIAGEVNASYTTPSLSATTTYYVAVNNGSCESARTAVVATISPLPSVPAATGATNCGSGAVTLNATGGSTGQYRWYTVATGGTPIAGQTNASYTTPSITTSTTYYVSIDNSTCESNRTAVVATISPVPSAPSATGASTCGAGAVTLNATGGSTGQYRWYTVATGGTPIAGQTNASYITPAITTSTTYYVSIDNSTCESNRTAVVATINPLPSAPSATGASTCGAGSVTLNATGGSTGQYRWYTVATGGTPIAGQTNSSFSTPSITTTTTYYASIDNGSCESNRTAVVATVSPVPAAPSVTGASGCAPSATVTLNASGGSPGQYRWYTVATGGSAIAGQTNFSFTTSAITTTTTYYVSIYNGVCESTRTSVTATIQSCVTPPSVNAALITATVGSISTTLNLLPLITVFSGTVDISSLVVVGQPPSGAKASIINGQLKVDYTGIAFTGTETVVVRVCDTNGSCTVVPFEIEVAGDIIVFNAISPDGANPTLELKYIDLIPETQNNVVLIFDRWQNEVWRGENYNNNTVVFRGDSADGGALPTGTYFYKIQFASGRRSKTGFISLKR